MIKLLFIGQPPDIKLQWSLFLLFHQVCIGLVCSTVYILLKHVIKQMLFQDIGVDQEAI